MITWSKWFSAAMWLGILVNFGLGIPAILKPNETLQMHHQTPDLEHPVWPAFAFLLLVLLSVLYIPGAWDMRRYRATAILSVLARLAGVIFFLVLWPGLYPMFGYTDGAFFLLQTPLLILAIRQQSQTQV
jgi:hypothetical protein